MHLPFKLTCLSLLLLTSCLAQPPHEKGKFKPSHLVDLIKLDTAIHLDIRYATTNNFAHTAVYAQARAFLQQPAAAALLQVSKALQQQGFGLMIYDGYRPWSVTKKFWDITPVANKQFVADPAKGSRHNRGCAVDLTLYYLSTGKQVEMTGDYDEWSERSYPHYTGGTTAQRQLRDLLRTQMEAQGFTVYPVEWWHFDYKDWKDYKIENVDFEEIK